MMASLSVVFKYGSVIGSLLAYLFTIALNAYLNIPGISPFNVTIGNMSEKYSTGITPAAVTFSIWGLIYLWQLVLIVYTLTLLCRQLDGKYLIVDPGILSTSFFVSYIVNLIGNPAWIFVFLIDNQWKAFVILALGVVSLVLCLLTSVQGLDSCGYELTKRGLKGDIWATRILVQNGIALYLAWVCCATLIGGVIVFKYLLGYTMETCCLAALAVLTGIILTWFTMEMIYDRQLRYVFAHYISLLAALSGIYVKQFGSGISYTYVELALLILVSVLAAVKLSVIIVRAIYDPIHYPQVELVIEASNSEDKKPILKEE